MPRKEDILENVDQYSPEELVSSIKAGIVSFDELCNDTYGEFTANKRREVKHKLESGDSDEWEKVQSERTIEAVERYLSNYPKGKFRSQARALKSEIEKKNRAEQEKSNTDDAWASVDKSNIESLRKFVRDNPHSDYCNEANNLINALLLVEINGVDVETLVDQICQFQTDPSLTPAQKDNNIIDSITRYLNDGKITKEEFLKKIAEDHNLLNAGVVKRLINSGTLSIADLVCIGIDKKFIQKMFQGATAHSFTTPEKLDKINKQSTEIYFWGIPSSGKSCALGAILSVAASGRIARSMDPDTESQGYGYMMKRYQEEKIPPSLSYKETEAYAALTKLKCDINYCINNVNNRNRVSVNSYIKQIYGDYTIEKIISLGEETIIRLSKKLMKVCAKTQIDIERNINKNEEKQTIYYK